MIRQGQEPKATVQLHFLWNYNPVMTITFKTNRLAIILVYFIMFIKRIIKW